MADMEIKAPSNFIKTIIEEDLARPESMRAASPPAFRRSPTATCTSATPSPSASTSVWPRPTAAPATCASTTPTPPRKTWSTWTPSRKMCAGWGSTGMTERYYASDYFEQLYDLAVRLIKDGKAYVDSLSADEIREYRGTLTEPGKESPYRNRTVEENLDLFQRMRAGEFDGRPARAAGQDRHGPSQHATCAIRPCTASARRRHHRTGDRWCIYPMYDFTHCLSDAIEGITHSICTLEFENNRALYDWVLDQLGLPCRPAAIRIRPPEPELHGAEQAQADPAGQRRAWWTAGTTRACPPSAGCGAGAIRPRPSATSASASAWPRPTAWWTSPCWSTPSAKI